MPLKREIQFENYEHALERKGENQKKCTV